MFNKAFILLNLLTLTLIVSYQNCSEIDLIQAKNIEDPERDFVQGSVKYDYRFVTVSLNMTNWMYTLTVFDSSNEIVMQLTFQTGEGYAGYKLFKENASNDADDIWFSYNTAQNQIRIVQISSSSGQIISETTKSNSSSSNPIFLFDYNGDGTQEILTQNSSNGEYQILRIGTGEVLRAISYNEHPFFMIYDKLGDLNGDRIPELIYMKTEYMADNNVFYTTMIANGSTLDSMLAISESTNSSQQSVRPQTLLRGQELIHLNTMGAITFYDSRNFDFKVQRNITVDGYNRYGQYHLDSKLSVGNFNGQQESILYSAVEMTETFTNNQTEIYTSSADYRSTASPLSLKEIVCESIQVEGCKQDTSCIYQKISSVFKITDNDTDEITFVRNCSNQTSYEGTIYLIDPLSKMVLVEVPISTSPSSLMLDHLIVKNGKK